MDMGHIKKDSLSHTLLTALEKSVDGVIRTHDVVYNLRSYVYGNRGMFPLKKSALSKAIARLREKNLIDVSYDDEGQLLKLTDRGKQTLFLAEPDKKKWDGRWRIVIWDIPEQKRLIRNLFRRNLKKWGFKPLQRSVWISKKHVGEKLISYVKYLEIDNWVLVIEADKIGPRIIP